MEDRYNRLLNIVNMPLIKFSMLYENVEVNDGVIDVDSIKERERSNGYTASTGRRYYRVGSLWRN